MQKNIQVIVANPSGNITIMVLTPVDRKDYKTISDRLLAIDFKNEYGVDFENHRGIPLFGEQVSFVVPPSEGEAFPSMDMCGLEFCGNASRAFAQYVADENDLTDVTVNVSGCSHPVRAYIDRIAQHVSIEMPVPVKSDSYTYKELGICNLPEYSNKERNTALLVDLDGISHLILEDVQDDPILFESLKQKIYNLPETDFPAFGVMFIDTVRDVMTPVVYVRDANTIYFEGSCASGTTAASYALAAKADDGIHEYTFIQPSGTLYTTVKKENGQITSVLLNGILQLSDVISVEI